jgi:hypothetical protein
MLIFFLNLTSYLATRKFEIQISKFETNSNKIKISKSSSVVLVIGEFEFDICFGFRISIFEFYKV